MGAGRWGQRAEVGAAARERALASGADLWDLPVSRRKRRGAERGLARGDRWARRAGDGDMGQKGGGARGEGEAAAFGPSWAGAAGKWRKVSGPGCWATGKKKKGSWAGTMQKQKR